ncbi:transcriptional repressor general negative regulator of transcription subunit 4 [Mortierella sp. GBA30]|nr:transcriptional repressor general negative regulator of transcription subunit 4 [Mortierella sp. GBA30]
MYSDEEDYDCPLCMEELDISDRNFRPCPCGYQICRFCWHHIKEDLNGRCPACRRVYSEEQVEFTPISADELAMIKNEKKAKEREKKEIEAMNRKHLSNMRVVQKSLVYVIGLPAKLANDEHTLRQHEYFGQYGKISKVVINRRNAPMPVAGSAPGVPSVGVYITYARKEDAAKAIAAIDGSIWDGKILRASYGTTKYCTYYLRGMSCQNPGCMYLHEPGEDADSYTKEDLAVGPKPAVVVASNHSASSSLSDWPAPGEKSNSDERDRDEEGSALPATASWAKIGSNPSTPTLVNSTPLMRRTTTEPPPLRAKGSTTSIITGVVVNNGKKKETTPTSDIPALDYEPTPAEALAIEAAAKQQLLQEQRQLQEQQRKAQKQQLRQQEEPSEQQVEVLNRKLRRQREQQEQEQLELQRQKQQQEMEQKLLAQKENEQKKKEKEEQEKKERELREQQEKKEKEEREESERREREEKERLDQELREQEEQKRKAQLDSMFVAAPTLSLGSFSFNPDASLATQPLSFGQGSLMPLGSESLGSFGLDSFSAFANHPITPGQYTGSFNPFSMDDEPLMRRSAAAPTRSFLDDADYDPATGRSRPVGPPIPGKPRQTSRFGFAMDSDYVESTGLDEYPEPSSQSMQDGFRALFPNVNVSFGQNNGLSTQQQQHMQQQQLQQLQHQQQQQYQSSPLQQHRQEAMQSSGMWGSTDRHDAHMFQRSMSQLSLDPMLTTPSSRMAEYHQQLQMQQQQQQVPQRNGPPGITRNASTPSMVKSPPPGLESVVRSELGQWSGSQQQQQNQQQSSRMNGWGGDDGLGYTMNGGSGPGQADGNNAQDFFGAFLKAAAASPQTQPAHLLSERQNSMSFQDPAIMTARISAAGGNKASLVEALQAPLMQGGLSGYRMMVQDGQDANQRESEKNANDAQQQQQQHQQRQQQQQRMSGPDSPSSLQNFPLGSKRKEIKSVKGVLNSGMNAPLNGGSRSRPSSTPGSPLVEPRLQLHTQQQQQQQPSAFGAGESPIMNGLTSAAARSAKVKSELLMGLNSPSTRPDRFSAGNANNNKDLSEAGVNGHFDMNHQNIGGMNGYGQTNINGINSTVSGPPPGLGMPSSSNSSSNNNSPYLMSSLLGRNPGTGQENGPNGMPSYMTNGVNSSSKPLDVASMMSALDFFGPGQASSLMMSPSWSMTNGNHENNGSYGSSGSNSQQQHNGANTDRASPVANNNSSTNNNNSVPSATARSVEDLELQVINAKMETQMLENQLNAVIKRNRRKLYA